MLSRYRLRMPVRRLHRLPRPSWDDLSARTELSTAQLRVLEAVEKAHRPLRAAHIAAMLGLHHNTVREHLEALVDDGFICVTAVPTGQRGRPALVYSATAPNPGEVLDSYLALLEAIADTLGAEQNAQTTARAIGQQWARNTYAAAHADTSEESHAPDDQTRPEPLDTTTNACDGLEPLIPSLVRMGFAPEPAQSGITLKACPLITATRTPSALVCLMHEGFLNETLAQHGSERATNGDHLVVTRMCPDGCRLAWAGSSPTAS